MLKVLIASNNIQVEPIINELEALGHEVTLIHSIEFAKEEIFQKNYDIIFIDYKESQKLSEKEVFEIRYFSHVPYELPIYILTENEKSKIDIGKRLIYSGVFPYNHSLNMINEFITSIHPLNTKY